MRAGHSLMLTGLVSALVVGGGCSRGPLGIFARANSQHDQEHYWGSIEEQIVLDDSIASPVVEGEIPVVEGEIRQASATTIAAQPQPALITLAGGDDLEARIASVKGTVLLDFYADWCGPCRKQGKILHEIESTVAANDALVVKIDFDRHQALAKKYQVESLPTLIVIKDGKVTQRKVGLTKKQDLIAWVE